MDTQDAGQNFTFYIAPSGETKSVIDRLTPEERGELLQWMSEHSSENGMNWPGWFNTSELRALLAGKALADSAKQSGDRQDFRLIFAGSDPAALRSAYAGKDAEAIFANTNIKITFTKQLEDAAAQPDTSGSDYHLMLCARDAFLRVERIAASMKGRAEDNPQGIKAETLAMFAEELELAIKP